MTRFAVPDVLGAARAPDPAEVLAAELDLLEIVPFNDPVAALAPADDAERRARALDRQDLVHRARLVRADAQGRGGDVAGAGRTSHEVNRWALQVGQAHVRARSHRLISAFFDRIGDFAAALEHALLALEHSGAGTPDRTRADHVMALAVALGRVGSFAAARERFLVAEQVAAALHDVPLGLVVLNNQAYIEHCAGDAAGAMASAERLLTLAADHGLPLDITYRDTVARAQMGIGLFADAERTLLVGLAEDAVMDADMLAEALVTLAKAQRLQGHLDAAGHSVERCAMLCERDGLHYVRVQLLEERAELLAAAGRYREAYEQVKAFHAEQQAQSSEEAQARARALHAVLDTEQARRDSDRFRELSVRDPLTGLYNRRYVEERTPGLLRAAAREGAPLSVALLDVDHFKQVNDGLSHEVGDELLRLLAGRLAAEVQHPELSQECFAARLGGDEFLLVLPGVTGADAVALCTRLQQQVRRGVDVGVTVTMSIGVSSAGPGRLELSGLLSDADARLYAAKNAGRDWVVGAAD